MHFSCTKFVDFNLAVSRYGAMMGLGVHLSVAIISINDSDSGFAYKYMINGSTMRMTLVMQRFSSLNQKFEVNLFVSIVICNSFKSLKLSSIFIWFNVNLLMINVIFHRVLWIFALRVICLLWRSCTECIYSPLGTPIAVASRFVKQNVVWL